MRQSFLPQTKNVAKDTVHYQYYCKPMLNRTKNNQKARNSLVVWKSDNGKKTRKLESV